MGPALSAKAQSQLAAYHNPWSGTGQQTQIHDGSAQLTNGETIRRVATLDSAKAGGGPIEIIIYPGINSFIVSNCEPESNSQSAGAVLSHSEYGVLSDDDIQGADNQANATVVLKNDYAISKWRVVSQASHFSLLNTDEQNDGWFEAVKFSPREMTRDFNISPIENDGDATGPLAVHPNLINQSNLLDTVMANESTYSMGLLKDINKCVFKLDHLDKSHPWTDFSDYSKAEGHKWNPDESTFFMTHDPRDQAEILPVSFNKADISQYIYNNMDCIYLRVYPGATPCKLLVDTIMNHEVIYNPVSRLSNYAIAHDQDILRNARNFYQKLQAEVKTKAATTAKDLLKDYVVSSVSQNLPKGSLDFLDLR